MESLFSPNRPQSSGATHQHHQSHESNASTASLTVEHESFQSSSAPTSPTKIPVNRMVSLAHQCSQSGSPSSTCAEQSSSVDSTASADHFHPLAAGAFATGGDPLTGRHKSHRSVKFPDDGAIVTGYHEAPDPYRYVAEMVDNDVESVSVAYKEACAKQNIAPIRSVLDQIQNFKCNRMRAQDLILRGEQLDSRQCEALEEILKRVLFRLLDLDSCNLDCDGASALFDMIEFYESASHLSIANNTSIGVIGWQSLCRTLKKTSCLQYLDLSNTGLNEQILLIMGRTIRVGSHLVTLHLENAGLFGRRLAILVSSIKFNTSLRELYLGENKISAADCVQLGNLLRGNSFLNVLDLRGNLIQDIGCDHICEGLAHQPTTCSVFDLFELTHRLPMSQNAGILILNLSDNQLTSRAMSRLAQTLSQCRSLIGLDLSSNALGDDGVLILKEGLLQCKTLKYLNLSNTSITSEGSNALADVIAVNSNLSILDLSNNDINPETGFGTIRDALRANRRMTKLVVLPQSCYPPADGSKPKPSVEELVEEIDSFCDRNKAETKYDEIDDILNGHLRSDISIYSDIELSQYDSNNNSNNNNSGYSSGEDSGTSPFYCDNSEGNNNNNNNNSASESGSSDGERKKPMLMRTASLGSWERPVKSGRFSVSPVDGSTGGNSIDDASSPVGGGPPDIHISVDYSLDQGDEDQWPSQPPPTHPPPIYHIQVDKPSGGYDGSDDDNASDVSHENENDQLSELPSKDQMMMGMSRLLAPPQRSFRRMSSPAITGLPAKPKPKPNMQLKLSGNLESLDLRSSLPLSPTFFAKFDFSDLSLLRLPAEVEEIVSNLPAIGHGIGSQELIFQFEQQEFFSNPSSSNKAQSSQQRSQQCVY